MLPGRSVFSEQSFHSSFGPKPPFTKHNHKKSVTIANYPCRTGLRALITKEPFHPAFLPSSNLCFLPKTIALLSRAFLPVSEARPFSWLSFTAHYQADFHRSRPLLSSYHLFSSSQLLLHRRSPRLQRIRCLCTTLQLMQKDFQLTQKRIDPNYVPSLFLGLPLHGRVECRLIFWHYSCNYFTISKKKK